MLVTLIMLVLVCMFACFLSMALVTAIFVMVCVVVVVGCFFSMFMPILSHEAVCSNPPRAEKS
jgi:hypothetical protein